MDVCSDDHSEEFLEDIELVVSDDGVEVSVDLGVGAVGGQAVTQIGPQFTLGFMDRT